VAVLASIQEASKATEEQRPEWYQIPDDSKDASLISHKQRLFEGLCTQRDVLAARAKAAQNHFPDEEEYGNGTNIKRLIELSRMMEKQIRSQADPVLYDMQVRALLNHLLEVAREVSGLEQEVLCDDFETEVAVAQMAAMSLTK
jgi:hypothetical protein